MNWLAMEQWSPYAVGIGIGLLSWVSFLLSDQGLACSTAFARSAGMIELLFRGKRVQDKPYYRKFVPEIDWGWMLVLGVLIGAFASAQLSGTFRLQWVPGLWEATFGSSAVSRTLVALIGGALLGLGARWAGGCTSGHGISGTLQLALSSWIAAGCFFASGILTAKLIFTVIAP